MKWLLGIYVVLYLAALALLIIGTFGLFGQEQDPLAGVFLLPLGLPWNLLLDRMGLAGPLPAVLAPLLNIAIVWGLWRWAKGRRTAQ